MGYDLRAVKVLIVDDNLHMHRIVSEILGAMQIREIRACADPEQALEEAAKWGPDIVIADLAMESMDGLTLVREIRTGQKSPDPFVPIVVLSGHTDLQSVMKARDAGANDVLTKPVSTEALYKRVIGLIERPRPFVKTRSYFGPCRRRRERPFKGDDRRTAEAETIEPRGKKTAA